MANELKNYNPLFYANEALIHLQNALGLANRVHRGYDEERRTFGLGDTITIRKPSIFEVKDAPSAAQDLQTENVDIKLDQWKEVKFKVSDKEYAYTGQRIIDEHVEPAAYALADYIDSVLAQHTLEVKGFAQPNNLLAIEGSDITRVRKEQFMMGVPLRDAANMHLMVGGATEAAFLADPAFSQQQGAGDTGVTTQIQGTLGRKYGYEVFANQNTVLQGVTAVGDDNVSVDADITRGQTALGAVSGYVNDSMYPKGQILQMRNVANSRDGRAQRFVADDALTASGGGQVPAFNAVEPATYDISDSETGQRQATVLDIVDPAVLPTVSEAEHNLAFHRNFAAFAMARLPDSAMVLPGVNVASVQDPVTGLSLRARIFYEGNSSEIYVALDVLFGTKLLDGNLGARLINPTIYTTP